MKLLSCLLATCVMCMQFMDKLLGGNASQSLLGAVGGVLGGGGGGAKPSDANAAKAREAEANAALQAQQTAAVGHLQEAQNNVNHMVEDTVKLQTEIENMDSITAPKLAAMKTKIQKKQQIVLTHLSKLAKLIRAVHDKIFPEDSTGPIIIVPKTIRDLEDMEAEHKEQQSVEDALKNILSQCVDVTEEMDRVSAKRVEMSSREDHVGADSLHKALQTVKMLPDESRAAYDMAQGDLLQMQATDLQHSIEEDMKAMGAIPSAPAAASAAPAAPAAAGLQIGGALLGALAQKPAA